MDVCSLATLQIRERPITASVLLWLSHRNYCILMTMNYTIKYISFGGPSSATIVLNFKPLCSSVIGQYVHAIIHKWTLTNVLPFIRDSKFHKFNFHESGSFCIKCREWNPTIGWVKCLPWVTSLFLVLFK